MQSIANSDKGIFNGLAGIGKTSLKTNVIDQDLPDEFTLKGQEGGFTFNVYEIFNFLLSPDTFQNLLR